VRSPDLSTGSASQKPLWLKLGVSGDRPISLIDAPRGWQIPGSPPDVTIRRQRRGRRGSQPSETIIAFFGSLSRLREDLPALAQRIFPAGALWVAWPRRAAGHTSDIRESDIRELALPLGLVDVKVAALDGDWSGLRLVWRTERRRTRASGRG
jgi:hypothetical protein